MRASIRRRISWAVVVCAAALAVPAAAAGTPPLHFSAVPDRAVAGRSVSVEVAAPAGTRCALSVRYRNGEAQSGLEPVLALKGRASWTWVLADTTAAGAARITATCGRARISRTIVVVGSLVPPRITVEKSGFSIRPKFGGTTVSWGLVLRNSSPNADALDVYVLVNFLLADDRALGTKTQSIGGIRAGQVFYLGGEMKFPGAAPITRLEPVIQIGGHQRRSLILPAITNLVIEPSTYDAGWVGGVRGELVNDDPPWVFQSAKISTVVFDASDNVIGGGTGFANALLPPGTRQVFKATLGLSAIPLDKAARAMVSVVPKYSPGTEEGR